MGFNSAFKGLNSSCAFSSECCPPLTSQHEDELETRHAVSTSAILGFRREVDRNCPFLGYYAASSGNFLPTFRDDLSVPSSGSGIQMFGFLIIADETEILD